MDDLQDLYVLIKRFEGCRLTAYLCPAGVWTCGWGSTGADVFPGRTWAQEYADQRMMQDAARFAAGTIRLVPNLEQGSHLSAIADFAYNCGIGALQMSTLRKRLLAGDMPGACAQLRLWVNGGGRKLPGLVLRREAECLLLG